MDKIYTKEDYQNIVNNCKCLADFCRALNYAPTTGAYLKIHKIINLYDIDVSHFVVLAWNKGLRYRTTRHSLDDILNGKVPQYTNIGSLKKRLIVAGIKEPKCEICGYSDTIELHHINGNHTDHRLENLQILCPNCHAKTNNFRGKNIVYAPNYRDPKSRILTDEEAAVRDIETKARKLNKTLDEYLNGKNKSIQKPPVYCKYCGKAINNRRRTKYCSIDCYRADQKNIKRPSAIQLILDLKEIKTFTGIAQKYDVSGNAVRKWCKLYMLPVNVLELNSFLIENNIVPTIIRHSNGYNLGELNSSYGTKWINNGIIHKKVAINIAEHLVNTEGWQYGKLK